MSGSGRPLRFLTIVLAGWTGARVAVLWPSVESPRDLIRVVVPVAAVKTPVPVAVAPTPLTPPLPSAARVRMTEPATRPALRLGDERRRILALFGMISFITEYPKPSQAFGAPVLPAAPQPQPIPAERSRWSASAWLLARSGGGAAAGRQARGSVIRWHAG